MSSIITKGSIIGRTVVTTPKITTPDHHHALATVEQLDLTAEVVVERYVVVILVNVNIVTLQTSQKHE